MEFITINGAGKPISRLIKGTDYFVHDAYEKLQRIWMLFWRLAEIP